jgi:2-keto-3-deoxy-L-rhamnonate aldolase RhmA
MEHAPNELPNILSQLQAVAASHAVVEPLVQYHLLIQILIYRLLSF